MCIFKYRSEIGTELKKKLVFEPRNPKTIGKLNI